MGSKNTYLNSYVKGQAAEQVVWFHFQSLGFKLIALRKKLKFAEVDLILEAKKEVLFVEVKTLHNDWMSFNRISKKQILRLEKNRLYYQKLNKNKNIKNLLVWVKPDSSLEFIDLINI